MLVGEFICGVDATVAAGAKSGLVGAAQDGGLLDAAHIALYLHLAASSPSSEPSLPFLFFLSLQLVKTLVEWKGELKEMRDDRLDHRLLKGVENWSNLQIIP